MFKLNPAPSYLWPVTVELPAETGGIYEKHTFDGMFKRLPQERLDAIFGKTSDDNDTTVISEVLVGWEGVVGDDGQPVPFSPSNLRQLLQVQGVRAAIVAAWLQSLVGAKQKN